MKRGWYCSLPFVCFLASSFPFYVRWLVLFLSPVQKSKHLRPRNAETLARYRLNLWSQYASQYLHGTGVKSRHVYFNLPINLSARRRPGNICTKAILKLGESGRDVTLRIIILSNACVCWITTTINAIGFYFNIKTIVTILHYFAMRKCIFQCLATNSVPTLRGPIPHGKTILWV